MTFKSFFSCKTYNSSVSSSFLRKSTSSSATRNRRRPRPDEKFRSGSPSRPSRRRPATRIKKSDGATRPVGSRHRKSRNRSKLPVRITRTRSRRCCCVTRNDPDRRRRRPPSRRTTTATAITSKSSFPRFVYKLFWSKTKIKANLAWSLRGKY
jgi:hypothetical protein